VSQPKSADAARTACSWWMSRLTRLHMKFRHWHSLISRPASAFAAGDLPLCQRPVPRPCEGDGILPRPSHESRCQSKQLELVTLSSLLSAGLASESPCAFLFSELPSKISFCFFVNDRTANRRSRLHLRSCSTRSDVEDKAGSTIEVRLNSSESIINAICSHTRGSFSIS
jgi:hypothetical protein